MHLILVFIYIMYSPRRPYEGHIMWKQTSQHWINYASLLKVRNEVWHEEMWPRGRRTMVTSSLIHHLATHNRLFDCVCVEEAGLCDPLRWPLNPQAAWPPTPLIAALCPRGPVGFLIKTPVTPRWFIFTESHPPHLIPLILTQTESQSWKKYWDLFT